MLVFVTSVKHPNNSQSYEKVWQLLNNTLYSVCSQSDQNFQVIVVCDKQISLFHHEELINRYTEFVEVDFPSHGEDVLNKFNRLGNLSPSLDDPKWWENRNYYKTSRELLESGNFSFLLQILKRLVEKRVFNKLREIKFRIRPRWKGKKNYKLIHARDHFHIANVVLNMGSKLLIGILTAKKYNPDYVMFFDADDYVGKDISAYVNSHLEENGWIMAHGYKMSGNRIAPFYRWNSICGTGNIFNYSILMEFVGPEVSEKSTQNELFEHVDSELFITIGRHDRPRSYFEKRRRPLLEYPTRSVIQLVGHNESSQYARKIIRGETVDSRLKNAQKFGEMTTISSTLIDYFNILPSNLKKVFCLGFQRTGTTSVDWVLADMGYQVAKAYKQPDIAFSKMLKQGDLSEVKRMTELFDAFQDIPWFLYYKEFDRWYPGSKFILTTRDSLSWWKSFSRYFRTESYPLFEYVYGFDNPVGHKKAFVERFEHHNREVIEYFKNRPDDLLVVDVSEDKTLHKISTFLGKSTSYAKMPHKNAMLHTSMVNRKNNLKGQLRKLKKIKQIHIVSGLKMLTFSKPPIIIGGSRKSGAELMLSILSCHPNIHAIRNVQLNFPTRHPLTPEADRFGKSNLSNANNSSPPIDLENLRRKLLKNTIPLSAKHWCGASILGVLAYEQLLAYYEKDILILNLVRDGRDVVTEYDKRVMKKYVVDGPRWVYDVKAGMKFDDHPQVLTIRYEDLIQNYEEAMKKISEFIGENDFSPFLDYPKGATVVEDGYWIGKWKQPQYSDRIEHLFQTPGALKCLRHYGYTK